MPTAISRIYTPEGFVVASDSFVSGSQSESQKIFSFRTHGLDIVYCIGGTARLKVDTFVLFDFVEAAKHELSIISPSDTWPRYLDALSSAICQNVNFSSRQGVPSLSAEDDTFLFVDGYHNAIPVSARLRFEHGTGVTKATVATEQLSNLSPYGSHSVLRLLDQEDNRFAPFVRPRKGDCKNIRAAVEWCRNRVLAQSSKDAKEIDPKICSGIGGRIQIALMKPTGFAWEAPPVSEAPSCA